MIISKTLTTLARLILYISNGYRKHILRLTYLGPKTDSKSVIEKTCKIICVDGGKLIIGNSRIYSGVHLFEDVGAFECIKDSSVGMYTHIVAKQSMDRFFK